MKISWFRRALHSKDIWCELLKLDLNEAGVSSIEELLRMTPDAINTTANKMKNPFWKEAMKALSQVSNVFHSTNRQRAILQNPFNNNVFYTTPRKIKLPLRPAHYPWFSKKIEKLEDVMPKLKFLTVEELQSKYNSKPCWLEYKTFTRKIHECMKKIPLNAKNPHGSFQKFLLKCKGTAKIRAMEEEKAVKIENLKCFKKWNLELDNELTKQRYVKALSESMRLNIDVKIRYMQFRMLHRYIGTNHQVAKFKEEIEDICTFCKIDDKNTQEKETIKHLFYECNTTQKLLRDFYEKCLPEEIVHLNACNFLFTTLIKNDDKDKLLNHTNMILKFYVWSCKMRKQKPLLLTCEKYVKYQALCIARGLQISSNYNFMNKLTEKTDNNVSEIWEDDELRPAPPAPVLSTEQIQGNFEVATVLKLKKIRQKHIQMLISQLALQ